jgi:hypothetical protein
MNNMQNQYGMANDLASLGFNAAGQGATNATRYGQSMADLYAGMGDAQAQARLAQYGQNRALVGDLIEGGVRAYGAYGG